MAGEFCPHVGVEEDAQTAVAFPSTRNRCFRDPQPERIEIQHQADFCLCTEHQRCPIYLRRPLVNEPARSISPSTRPAQVQPAASSPAVSRAGPVVTHRTRDFLIIGLIGLALLGAWVVVLANLPDSSFAFGQAPTPTRLIASRTPANQPTSFLPLSEINPTSTVTRAIQATMIKITSSVTPTPTKTRKLTQTAPSTPTITQTALVQATVNCGAPLGWVPYVIRAGDTLSLLSRIFNVSIQQLQQANCMGSQTNLYAGQVMYVPFIPPTVAPPTPIPSATTAPTRAPTKTSPPPAPSNTPVTPEPEPSATPVTPEPEPSATPVTPEIVPSATPVTPEP